MHIEESVVWFVGQVVAAWLAGVAGWRIARCEPRVWKRAALLATVLMLAWPFMRFFPAHVIRWLGANLACEVWHKRGIYLLDRRPPTRSSP